MMRVRPWWKWAAGLGVSVGAMANAELWLAWRRRQNKKEGSKRGSDDAGEGVKSSGYDREDCEREER
jgi:hypothetical protein